jgi:steroid delta-isomerase-like uncharacterized protein
MTSDEIRGLLDDFVQAWQRQDVKALGACYAEDCVVVSPIFHTLNGRGQVEQSFKDLFRAFENQTLRVDDIVISCGPPDRAVLVCTLQPKHVGEIFGMPPSGKRIDRTIAYVQSIADRRITRETRIYDFTSMLMQLGVLRVKAG